MTDTQHEIIQSLKTAIELEKKGLITFLTLARQTKSEVGKNMFIQLALDENEHRRILEEQLDKVLSGKSVEKMEIAIADLDKILPKINERVKKIKGEANVDEVDALNSALDLENNAEKFFQEQANNVADPAAKNMFLKLAEWENNHYRLIQAELDSLQQTGFWFDMPEFMMDGKV